MEQVISIMHGMLLVCLPLAGIVLLVKAILVFQKRGANLAAYIISFFRLYGSDERKTLASKSWRRYMLYNNILNYLLYFCIGLFLIMLIIYQKDIFNFS
jgi:putative flippase GtrA